MTWLRAVMKAPEISRASCLAPRGDPASTTNRNGSRRGALWGLTRCSQRGCRIPRPSGKKQSGWGANAFGKNLSDWCTTLEPNGKNVSRPQRAKCHGELKSTATRAGKRFRRLDHGKAAFFLGH